VLKVDESSDEDIKEFVGRQKFYSDGSGRFVTYSKNGVGLISKLNRGDTIVKRDDKIVEICNGDAFANKYETFNDL